MKIRVSDYIVNFLVDHGIKDIFVLTGYGAMYLNDAIVSNGKLNYYCVRNEAASPMMAEAYARSTGTPGAVCLTAGPGSTNAVPGLAEAWVDSAPIIIISGQVHKKHTTYFTKLKGLRTFGTAEINIIPIVKPLTKYAEMVTSAKSIRYHLEKAYYKATNGRPGPVWLDIPHDIQYSIVDTSNLKGFVPPKIEQRNIGRKLEKATKLLRAAKHPLIIAGQGVKQSNSLDNFSKLISSLKIPVVLSRLGLDMLPYDNPLNMGLGGIKGTRFNTKILREADLLLVLGSRLAIPLIGLKRENIAKNAKIIAVDIENDELKKPGVKVDVPINTDIGIFIKQLLRKVEKWPINKSWQVWLTQCQELKSSLPMVNEEMKKDPIDLYYFMSKLDEISNKKNILITDAGSNYYVGGQVYKFNNGQKEITSGTFAAMGLSIPLAIGASVANKKQQILAVTGDGSLELNIQELKTMSYYNFNIKLFVINNNGYLSMRKWQDTYFKGRRIGSDDDSGAETLNLRKVAEAFDLKYEIIEKHADIVKKLKNITSVDGPLFVEVICDDKQKIVEPLSDF